MKIYPEDYDVELTVNFTDLNGAEIVPTEVSAKLYDGEDMLVHEFGQLFFEAGDKTATLVVPGAFNQLAEGELSAARIVRFELVTAAGSVRRAFSYVIEGEFRLAIMTNTFMSYEVADLLARDAINATGWQTADDTRRQGALIEAFNRLTRIPMRFSRRDAENRLVEYDKTVITRNDWAIITPEEFQNFPAPFKQALRGAQLAEANEVLQGDVISSKARSGIISETIGESSVRLSTRRADFGISSPAMSFLAGYVHFNMRIARS